MLAFSADHNEFIITGCITIVTGSVKTLHVRIFYACSQKQLKNQDRSTDFQFLCTKITLENVYSDDEIFTMLQSVM